MLSGSPAEDLLLITQAAQLECVLFCGGVLAVVHIVDAIAQPDAADLGLCTMQVLGDLFRGAALDADQADLPASLIFYDLAILQGQTLTLLDVADGADINFTTSSVLHDYISLCCVVLLLGVGYGWAARGEPPIWLVQTAEVCPLCEHPVLGYMGDFQLLAGEDVGGASILMDDGTALLVGAMRYVYLLDCPLQRTAPHFYGLLIAGLADALGDVVDVDGLVHDISSLCGGWA